MGQQMKSSVFHLPSIWIIDIPDMVVSGVPKENGINHAGEIASMALDLVNVCHNFKIPHKPNTQLKIRAGIHSGAAKTWLSCLSPCLTYWVNACLQ